MSDGRLVVDDKWRHANCAAKRSRKTGRKIRGIGGRRPAGAAGPSGLKEGIEASEDAQTGSDDFELKLLVLRLVDFLRRCQ